MKNQPINKMLILKRAKPVDIARLVPGVQENLDFLPTPMRTKEIRDLMTLGFYLKPSVPTAPKRRLLDYVTDAGRAVVDALYGAYNFELETLFRR